ncbi:helix-turn-helix domain-containing protein [Bradyrhizobium erythrophlei]|uniref:LysR family transcriptional regulator n=1 Tax=Bradyrhizobium erythrophlei TaxID=1437360 RepID=UPI0009F8207D
MESFRAVVREGGAFRAALRLHRVQSTVKTLVKQLEQWLGVALSQRQGCSLVLMTAGERLPACSDRLLRLAGEAESAVRHAPRQHIDHSNCQRPLCHHLDQVGAIIRRTVKIAQQAVC